MTAANLDQLELNALMISKSIHSVNLMPLLWKRKKTIFISALAASCAAFAVAKVLPLQYVSEGSIILENRATAADPTSPSVANGVLTQIDVLQSTGLARQVILQQRLADLAGLQPAFRLTPSVSEALRHGVDRISSGWHAFMGDARMPVDAIDTLVRFVQKHLEAKAKENSSVISVQFVAGTPEAASTVANAVMGAYETTMRAAKDAQIASTESWIAQQTIAKQHDIDDAQQRLVQFTKTYDVAEVQGSLTTAVLLSKLQAQLGEAQEALSQAQAARDTLARRGSSAATEMIASRTIQKLKELGAVATERLNQLAPTDPRRVMAQAAITSLQGQLKTETDLMSGSIGRDLEISQAKVVGLQKAVQDASAVARTASVVGTLLKQLTSDLEAKRQAYVDLVKQFGQMRMAAQQASSAHILFPAVPPQQPLHAYGTLSLILGCAAGTIGATGVILARTALRSKIVSSSDMTMVTGISVLGCLPDLRRPAMAKSVLVAETLRAAWLGLRSPPYSLEKGNSVVVTSGEVGEGKTTIALALACRIAADGFRVLLIDGDLRQSTLSSRLGLATTEQACLEAVLTGVTSFDQAVLHHAELGLDCILARGAKTNSLKLLLSSELRVLIAQACQRYDLIVIDSPPVLRVADALLLAKHTENILFIVEAGRMADDLILEAIRRFPDGDQRKMQALLTRVRPSYLTDKDYYGGYEKLRLT